MKISFPSKEVYPKFTSVILHGPTVEWQWQGCKGGGGWSGATPRAPPPPAPRGIDTSFELVAMETANRAGRRRCFGMVGARDSATRDSARGLLPLQPGPKPYTYAGNTQRDLGEFTLWKHSGHVLP